MSPNLPITFPLGSEEKLLRVSTTEGYNLVEYTSAPDNRYTPEFIDAYLEALAFIRIHLEPKVLITTSVFPKFFSNGLDFERAIVTEGFMPDRYYRLMRAVMEFPQPTIAVVNGHAFAAGFMIAACHDFRIMNPNKGYLCMNEVEFGAPILPPMMSIYRVKFGTAITQKITLQAHRFTAKEALANKLIDGLGGMEEGIALAEKLSKFANAVSYAAIRKELLKEVITDTLSFEQDTERLTQRQELEDDYYEKKGAEIEKKLAKL
ncbi:hypothetical protein AWJ20_2899 [Sugiyamaella lignohabitans]|uniref:Uncharacterized protein n=1 Tax=Sugiyamaella lignohabitans TaxID=796027 RepID=A0A167FGL0_9ASCO|nr:uncharacterized protein AWJ20_2899 [Sugiyamaella lignohabitans]ANB15273.1 hypothetical protein AWJ20_2899 [Sugiyamaella lignohabitans]